jgi:hypothetical protein
MEEFLVVGCTRRRKREGRKKSKGKAILLQALAVPGI